MKIADIAEFYSEQGGGVRTYVRAKLAASARLGHETVIIAPGPEDKEVPLPGGKIVWVKAPVIPFDRRYHLFVGGDGVRQALAREQPDVIEGSSPWRGGWLAGHWPGAAVKILVMHADPVAVYPHTVLDGLITSERIDRVFGWFWRYLRKLNAPFDATVVAGHWLKHRFEGFGLDRIHVVPFGVDRAIFRPAARDPAARRIMQAACGLDENAAIVVNVGRHHPEKRLKTVMEGVVHAGRTHPVGLYMIGDGISGPAVKRMASSMAHVHVAGQIEDRRQVAAFMASADALVHGSACETYGLAVAEALCCGTPLVVPDRGGAVDFAGPGYSEIYRAGDAQDASDALLRLLARSQADLRIAAAQAANVKIDDASMHFERLFALYESLVVQKPKTPGR